MAAEYWADIGRYRPVLIAPSPDGRRCRNTAPSTSPSSLPGHPVRDRPGERPAPTCSAVTDVRPIDFSPARPGRRTTRSPLAGRRPARPEVGRLVKPRDDGRRTGPVVRSPRSCGGERRCTPAAAPRCSAAGGWYHVVERPREHADPLKLIEPGRREADHPGHVTDRGDGLCRRKLFR